MNMKLSTFLLIDPLFTCRVGVSNYLIQSPWYGMASLQLSCWSNKQPLEHIRKKLCYHAFTFLDTTSRLSIQSQQRAERLSLVSSKRPE